MIWPTEALRAAGHDVTVVQPEQRELQAIMRGEEVVGVHNVPDIDVIVFQRVTHRRVVGIIKALKREGIAVVIDVDDDLEAIHPRNPAWTMMHPANEHKRRIGLAQSHSHSWTNLAEACREASLVTVTSPALIERYAKHGRGMILQNFLPDHYYGIERVDSAVLGWPASLHSHPDDPSAVGPAIARLVREGVDFRIVSDPLFCGRAFGLAQDPPGAPVPMEEWPAAIAQLGIGIAPLADTKFNAAKSWLKPLELSAVGVPWVASPRVEYDRLHQLGAGLLARKPQDWYRKLKQLTEDVSMRAELSTAGREVAETLRLRDHAWRWLDAWQQARVNQDAVLKRKSTNAFFGTV